MREFKEFGIQPQVKSFTGDKIRIDKLLNRKITVHEYKIEKSKYEGKGMCLTMQIALSDEMRVVFTSGTALMDVLERIPKDGFPFTSTIVKENERLIFT
jgi:hypothetical protein